MKPTSNTYLADLLDKLALLLQEDGGPSERAGAWRAASGAVRSLHRPVADVLRSDGLEGLASLPGVGAGLAVIISAMLEPDAESDTQSYSFIN